jgi:hypothetical protein
MPGEEGGGVRVVVGVEEEEEVMELVMVLFTEDKRAFGSFWDLPPLSFLEEEADRGEEEEAEEAEAVMEVGRAVPGREPERPRRRESSLAGRCWRRWRIDLARSLDWASRFSSMAKNA